MQAEDTAHPFPKRPFAAELFPGSLKKPTDHLLYLINKKAWLDPQDETEIKPFEIQNMRRITAESIFGDNGPEVGMLPSQCLMETAGCVALTIIFSGTILAGETSCSTLGRHDAVPEELAERIVALRAKHPRWTLARILGRSIEERRWNMVYPSRAILYR